MKNAFLLISIAVSSVCIAQGKDREQIKKAILNYVDAFYQADTTKAYESVAQDMAKRGYYTDNGKVVEATMSFKQMVRLAQRWKNNQKITPATPKKITVFDVLDRTASAKLEAQWGIDYFHLARLNGKWMIINVLWQEYPKIK